MLGKLGSQYPPLIKKKILKNNEINESNNKMNEQYK
jgi:hypothetical protein